MKITDKREHIAPGTDFISRLGYREMGKPLGFHCIRNGEPLTLNVYYFENRRSAKVVYYTEAIYMPTGQIRHTCIFRFNGNEDHLSLHKFCLYTLFLDEKITQLFEEQNKFDPPAHLNPEKAEVFLNWIRFYWNSRYFMDNYKMLGGLDDKNDLLKW